MFNLLLIILIGVIASMILEREIEDVLPVFVALMLVCLYFIGIAGYAHHSYEASIIVFIGIYITFVIINIKRRDDKKSILSCLLPNKKQLDSTFLNSIPIGFYIYVLMVFIMYYCYSTHFVNVWDDFHFNANLAKDMYYFGTMPRGYQHTTMYKDYFPTQQLFFYWGFQGQGKFTEQLMFQYKLFLAYTFMLPIFKEINRGNMLKRVAAGVLAIIMPFMCLFEILESLSMDTVLALIFANIVVRIMNLQNQSKENEEKTTYRGLKIRFNYEYIVITVLLMALALYKSYAFMFCGICLGILLFNEIIPLKEINKANVIRYIIIVVCTVGAYLSWRIFCAKYGNNTYLSDILTDNIAGDGGRIFPEYGKYTIVNLIKSLVTLNLNFGRLGITVFVAIALFVISSIVLVKSNKYSIKDLWTDIILMAGFVVFFLFLMYTYLFIFEPYEAIELTSIDRYLGSYTLVAVFVASWKLIKSVDSESTSAGLFDFSPQIILLGVFTIYSLVSLNYSLLWGALNPKEYTERRSDIYEIKMEVEDELSNINFNDYYGGRIMVVFYKDNCMYSRTMEFDMIPLKTYLTITSNMDIEDFADSLVKNICDNKTGYVYFSKQFLESEKGLEMIKELMDSGVVESNVQIKESHLYSYDEGLSTLMY